MRKLRTGPQCAQSSVIYNLVTLLTHEYLQCLPAHQPMQKINFKSIKILIYSSLELFVACGLLT